MDTILHFVGGREIPSRTGETLDNFEPATGRVYARVARGDAADVDSAVEAARAAFPEWSRMPAEERSRRLLRIADRIEADLETFARCESVDTGKPLAVARSVDIPRAVANFRFFATAILHVASEAHPTDATALNYTLRRPRGIAGLISPWNLPLYLLTWKIAPALACGNTAIAKPSELTPKTAELLARVCAEELPDGVLNVVHGLGAEAGAAIVSHPEVDTLSFTGGTATGATISRMAAPLFKKIALEMGGKNPTIVFEDAPFEEAVSTSVRAAFSNQGQICLCGSRIFVERRIYGPFLEAFLERTTRLRVGDPLDPETDQGALVSESHLEKVRSYVALATELGGTVACGGTPPRDLPARCRGGWFLDPTVVTGLDGGCRVNREEIFGPVVTIQPFDDEDEVVAWANDTPYGLAASLWTERLSRAHRMAERIASGTIWINCWMLRDLRVPFGGMKHSGVGREGGDEALRFFTEPKNVCLKIPGRSGEEKR